MSQNTSDPTRIERDLDQTRSRLGSHLSELQDKFSPGQVLDDLMGYFRGSEGAEFGRSLLQNVRGNPMPAAITAIGLAWLMASKQGASQVRPAPGLGQSDSHLYGRDDYGATMLRVRDAEQATPRQANEAEPAYAARLNEVRGQAIGLAQHAQESADSFAGRVRDAMAAAERAVTGAAQEASSQIGSAVASAGSTVSSLGASAQGMAANALSSAGNALSQGSKTSGNMAAALADNPVILGALGLAAGALFGALLPRSDQEEAALGGIAGQARETVTGLAKQGLESGKGVAQAVLDKGRESADAHGLTGGKSAGELVDAALSGELTGHAKAVVQDALKTGDEAVRREVAP